MTLKTIERPRLHEKFLARVCHWFPFFSGGGSIANHRLFNAIAKRRSVLVQAKTNGGDVAGRLDDLVGRAAFYFGDLDPKISWICSQVIQQGDTVLDVGANIGIVSILMSKLVGPSGTVHSFEPQPSLQECLNYAMERNQRSNLKVHPFALGAESGELTLRVPQGNAGKASFIHDRMRSDAQSIQVQVKTLDEFLIDHRIDKVRMIKIDVEGFEAEVIKGGLKFLEATSPDIILFELNDDCPYDPEIDSILTMLERLRFTFLQIPKCMIHMKLERYRPKKGDLPPTNDLVAVRQGTAGAEILRRLNVRN
ncbi:MAG: FkbM family methyltransferase [Planctomyces sp.]|nr:FkbM family methyltransferase [Planctomyces sp.]